MAEMGTFEEYRKEVTVEKIGYVYILKLIEKRVFIDIENDEDKMNQIKKSYYKTQGTEILYGIQKRIKFNSYKKIKKMKEAKEEWLRKWKDEVYTGTIEGLKEVEIIKIRNVYWEKCKDEKMFVILQESILSPIYYKIEKNRHYTIKENTAKKSAEILSRYLNLEEEVGLSILSKTKKFIREGREKIKIKANITRIEEDLKSILEETKNDKVENDKLLLFMIKSVNYIKYLEKIGELDKAYIIKEKFLEVKKAYEREVLLERKGWSKEKQEIINFIYNKLVGA
ncbi:MAG: hypothetical protein ACRDAU_03250 [Clostridium sp.]